MRKVLSVFVAVCLVLSLFTLALSAKADTSGDYQYTVAGGTATITGYTGPGGAIVIPSALGGYPVTAIGGNAFYERSSLTSVIIPNGVTSIGDVAFDSCTALTSVTIPNSVTSIGDLAFVGTALTSVTIPSSVTNVGLYAFRQCSSLTSIVVDPGNPAYASGTGGVLFNKTVTVLVQYPGGKQGAYVVPSSVTSIGDLAFDGCTALTSVNIPSSVTSIAHGAFGWCSSLTAAHFLGNAPTGTTDMFLLCHSGFTVYYLSGKRGWTNPWYGYPTAVSSVASFTLTTTTASPSAGGAIGRSPDASFYTAGTVVTLTAVPAAGYAFTGWSGALTGMKNPMTLILDANKNVTASFALKVKSVIQLKIGSRTMHVDGKTVILEAAPIILNSRTLLPIRAVVEAAGGTVAWEAPTQKVTIVRKGKTLQLWIGRNVANLDGRSLNVDSDPKVVPIIKSERTLLPLRFVAEALALDVRWNATTKAITITYAP